MIIHNKGVALAKSWLTIFLSPDNGGSSGDGSSSSGKSDAQAIVDHFKGIDLDELPQNVRDAVTKAQSELGTLQKSVSETSAKLGETVNFARLQQSRADKLDAVVRKHALPVDANGVPTTQVNAPVGDEAQIKERADRFEKQGLKADAAMAYARMFHEESKVSREALLKEFSPLVANVGNLQANTALSAVESRNSTFFAIPDVKNFVYNAVSESVKNGRPVNEDTVSRLLEMGYGQFSMKNPDKIVKNGEQIPNLGGGNMNGGSVRNDPNRQGGDNKAPVAKEPETIAIMNKVTADWKKDLPSHNKKGVK